MTKTQIIFQEYDAYDGWNVPVPAERQIELAKMAGLEVSLQVARKREEIAITSSFVKSERNEQDGMIVMSSFWRKVTVDDIRRDYADKENLEVAYNSDQTLIIASWDDKEEVKVFVDDDDLADFIRRAVDDISIELYSGKHQLHVAVNEEKLKAWCDARKAKNGQD